MIQKIIVAVLFAGALFWILRYLYRKYMGVKKDDNYCDKCDVK